MSKVLLFTHRNDIDGMGSAVLAKLAFEDVEYVPCATFELGTELNKYLQSGKIYDYDKIFVTDLWLEEPYFSATKNVKGLTEKFFIFDHHKSSFEHPHVADFKIVLEIKNEKGLCCGTSLFYEYLLAEGLLKEKKTISRFVELTRRHDTWEWKTKYNDEMARELALLFDILGADGYIDMMSRKLASSDESSEFEFDDVQMMLIDGRKKLVARKVEEYAKKLYYRDVDGLKAGVTFINYEYRNEFAEYLREQNYDIDFLMIVAMELGTISYRSVKDNVNVRGIAVARGGKGHDKAATNGIPTLDILKVIDTLV